MPRPRWSGAVICEELGLVGALGIIALLSALILRGYWIALHARDRFSTAPHSR